MLLTDLRLYTFSVKKNNKHANLFTDMIGLKKCIKTTYQYQMFKTFYHNIETTYNKKIQMYAIAQSHSILIFSFKMLMLTNFIIYEMPITILYTDTNLNI